MLLCSEIVKHTRMGLVLIPSALPVLFDHVRVKFDHLAALGAGDCGWR